MKLKAFTVAFGDEKYLKMAQALEKSMKLYSPSIDFEIIDESYLTPISQIYQGVDVNKLHPKSLKYSKMEAISLFNKEDYKYMYIDADSLVYGDISYIFDLVKKNQLLIEYIYNADEGWSGIKDLNFQLRSKEAGLEGIKPYSINSGFIVWQGKQNCFNDALYLIKNILIDDVKGRNGDEYYLCAALQRCNTQIVPIDYDKVKIVKMWNGKISYKNKKLKSDLYSDKRDIFHYGNQNYNHPSIFRAMDELGIKREYIFFNLLNLYQAIRFSSLVRAIRKFYKNLVK